MVGAGCLAWKRHIGPLMLTALFAKAAPGDLNICLTKQRVALALLDGHIGRGNAIDVRVVDVIVEANGSVLAGRIVEHALWRQREAGHPRVDLEWLPWLEAGGDLVRVHLRVAGGVEGLLRQHSGDLVVAVAIGHAANE